MFGETRDRWVCQPWLHAFHTYAQERMRQVVFLPVVRRPAGLGEGRSVYYALHDAQERQAHPFPRPSGLGWHWAREGRDYNADLLRISPMDLYVSVCAVYDLAG